MNGTIMAEDRLRYLGLRATNASYREQKVIPPIEQLPGEFAKEEVLSVAASAFDVPRSELAKALADTLDANKSRAHHPEATRQLLKELLADTEAPPLTVIACIIMASLVPIELTELLAEVRRIASETDIATSVVCGYLLSIVRTEAVAICADLIVFELNAARTHELISDTDPSLAISELRALLDDPGYLDYTEKKYPLLRDRFAIRLSLVARSVITTIRRIHAHAEQIARHFGEAANAQDSGAWTVTAIEPSSGDSHNGANRVTFVQFANGLKVVYKPRTTQGEKRFQHYLAFLEHCDPSLNFRKMKVLDCDGYGWVEFIKPRDVEASSKVAQYYFRYGALIAALDAISGTDIHFENLVAEGEHPVIVDLETVMQPHEVESVEDGKTRGLLSLDFYHDTPLITAMFDPAFLMGSLNGSPLSRSIGIPSSEVEVRFAEHRFVMAPVRVNVNTSHMPTLSGECVAFEAYIDDIMRGYRRVAYLIASNRPRLISGVLQDLFGNASVRIIFRYTRHYANIVKAVNSAYALQSLRNTEEILSRLWRMVSIAPGLTPVVAAEHFDVWNGDVPYFESTIESTSVVTSQGQRVDGVLSRSGWAATVRRILAKDHGRIAKECDLIEFCLRGKVNDMARTPIGSEKNEYSMGEIPRNPRELVSAIQDRMMIRDGRLLVMDIMMHRTQRSRQSMLGADFYTGTTGICFALAYGDSDSRNGRPSPELRSICEAALVAGDHESMLETGVCIGLGSGIYLAAHLSALWNDDYMQALGEHLAEHACQVLYTDRHFDLFSGSAGLLRALLALRRRAGPGRLDAKIEMVVDSLIANGMRSNGCLTWMSSIPSSGPTTGYAHGVSGIADALLAAGVEVGITRAIDAAMDAERFLTSCRVPTTGWRECSADASASHLDMWCHGTPGIALFYQALAKIRPERRIVEIAEFALAETERVASFENDSLCHGWLGNLEPLLLNEATAQSAAVAACLKDLSERQPRCGTERQHVSLGLFTGLAGIAYQQMRAKAPGDFPSVLTFAPPLR